MFGDKKDDKKSEDKATDKPESGKKAPSFLKKTEGKSAKGTDSETSKNTAKEKVVIEKGEKDKVRFNPTIPDDKDGSTEQNVKKVVEGFDPELFSEDLQTEFASQLEAISEDLSLSGRMKRRQIIRRMRGKLELKRERATSRRASSEVINHRARRMAIGRLKTKFSQGRNTADLSVSEKQRVERMVAARKKLIDRQSKRLVKDVRSIERDRLQGHNK